MIFNQGAFYLLAFATIGSLLSASLFIPNQEGLLTSAGLSIKKKASLLVNLWFITSFLAIILKIARKQHKKLN